MWRIIEERKAKSVGSYVGEPSCCDNGEPGSGCSLCHTVVTLKDCADIMSWEGTFYFEQGEKVLPLQVAVETGCRALA